MRWLCNQVRHYVVPIFGEPTDVTVYPANNMIPQIVTRGWITSQMIAPAKFTGMMPQTYNGELITAQTILRGVNPIDAAMELQGRSQEIA